MKTKNEPSPYALTLRTSVLLEAKKSLDGLREIVIGHETAFLATTLEPRCLMGLQCLRAYEVFAITEPKERGSMKGTKKLLTREELSDGGFSGWLKRETPWMKETTAYKYMNAVKGLGLSHSSTDEDVAEALAQHRRVGQVTHKMLCDAAAEIVKPQLPPAKPDHQLEFEFLRGELHAFAVQSNNILAIADQLKGIPQMHKAACARAYSMLRDLTGTDWQPSDIPDLLCEIDPDTIDL